MKISFKIKILKQVKICIIYPFIKLLSLIEHFFILHRFIFILSIIKFLYLYIHYFILSFCNALNCYMFATIFSNESKTELYCCRFELICTLIPCYQMLITIQNITIWRMRLSIILMDTVVY